MSFKSFTKEVLDSLVAKNTPVDEILEHAQKSEAIHYNYMESYIKKDHREVTPKLAEARNRYRIYEEKVLKHKQKYGDKKYWNKTAKEVKDFSDNEDYEKMAVSNIDAKFFDNLSGPELEFHKIAKMVWLKELNSSFSIPSNKSYPVGAVIEKYFKRLGFNPAQIDRIATELHALAINRKDKKASENLSELRKRERPGN